MLNTFINLKTKHGKTDIQCPYGPCRRSCHTKRGILYIQIKTGYLFEHEAVSKMKVDVVKAAIVLPELVNILVVVLVEVGEM